MIKKILLIIASVIVVAVVGYAVYHYKGADIRHWATGSAEETSKPSPELSANDFSALGPGTT